MLIGRPSLPRHRGHILLSLIAAVGSVLAISASSSAAARPAVGILPPADPASNYPTPAAMNTFSCTTDSSGSQSCVGVCVSASVPTLNESAQCNRLAEQTIDKARAREGVRSLRLPSNWSHLTVVEQLFVITDLERVDRGIPPIVGLVHALNSSAQTAANSATDPSYPPAGLLAQSGNWASSPSSPLIADFFWMYADGPGGTNVDCKTAHASGCWGHRNNILGAFTGIHCSTCLMGGGFDPAYRSFGPAYAELFIKPANPAVMTPYFTWAKNVAPFLS